MIAKESGNTAAPVPASARNAISDQMLHATAHPTQPARNSDEADHEQPLLAVLVAELAEDGRRNRRAEQEDGEHPGRPRRRRVELALDHRQRRNDHRLLERERGPGERQCRKRDVVVLPRVLHSEHEERDGDVLEPGGRNDERVEELVVAEDRRERIRTP